MGCRRVRRPAPHRLARQPQAVGQRQAARARRLHRLLHVGDRGRLQQSGSTSGPHRPHRGYDAVRALHGDGLPDAHLLRPRAGQARCADGVVMGEWVATRRNLASRHPSSQIPNHLSSQISSAIFKYSSRIPMFISAISAGDRRASFFDGAFAS